MKYRPTKTSKKGIRLCVNKSEFDAILNKIKNRLYRSVTDSKFKKYIKHKNVNAVEHYLTTTT